MAAVTATGCGAETEPPVGSIDVITRETQISRPIDGYLPSGEQLRQLWQVRGAATTACYAEHGTPGRTNVPPDLAARLRIQRQEDVTRTRLYGFFGPEDARSRGYGSAFEGQRNLEMPAPWSRPEVVRQCEKAGSEAIGDLTLVTDERILPDGGPPSATNDSRVTEAVSKWSACMTRAGYPYQRPIDPLIDPKWQRPISTQKGEGPPATPAEIAAATTDIGCKLDTNLVGVAVAVQSAYDRRYIAAHADALSRFKERLLGYTRTGTT
ncbi:hypothetical protein GCM10023192_00700 [Amycolatopsis samaneae]